MSIFFHYYDYVHACNFNHAYDCDYLINFYVHGCGYAHVHLAHYCFSDQILYH